MVILSENIYHWKNNLSITDFFKENKKTEKQKLIFFFTTNIFMVGFVIKLENSPLLWPKIN